MVDAGTSPQVAGHELGKELRRLREEAGLTADAAAVEVGVSQSQVTRIESNERKCAPEVFARFMTLYEVEADLLARLSDLLKTSRKRQIPWYRKRYGDLLSATYDRVLRYEEIARERVEYQLGLIPPHLQSPEYARCVTATGFAALGEDQIDGLVEVRMARQLRLTDEVNPLVLSSVITQAALSFHVGGREVMRRQLRHLLDVTELPNVTLRIIPWEGGENGTQSGSFNIFKFDSVDDVAFAESVAGSVFMEAEMDLRRVNRLYKSLAAAALSPDESRDLIMSIERDLAA